jgi:NAD(P)-dependent dehydrogenase (short-subunit alcohol dehydrogenase family)
MISLSEQSHDQRPGPGEPDPSCRGARSKAALNALTSTQAAEFVDTPIIVNAVCPGLTATYPGAEAMGARPVVDGAASVLWAATLPDDEPRRGLFRDGQPIGW